MQAVHPTNIDLTHDPLRGSFHVKTSPAEKNWVKQ